ncbi:MAG: NADPH azoreductase [candidate division WS6 bacterium OLB20]|uniref:NADPH azoreductase n=1 Tax=candidate division WS6 bacterium OLB20 TaxID=1617426 RepID=A0A136M0N7_9BACT|nr:MAG: NADPH azoreductase [candidate division WS6 bacterium OLB20]
MNDARKLKIVLIHGTSRPGNRTEMVTRFVRSMLEEHDEIELSYADPREMETPLDGNSDGQKDPRYSNMTAEADGFFIVTPEYNHGIPGSLKRLLDSELKNYIHKPVAFAGVSAGPWGGVRAIESLVSSVREMGMTACFTDVHFPKVQDLFDDDGNLLDVAFVERTERAVTELIWMARTMRYGRENIASRYHEV